MKYLAYLLLLTLLGNTDYTFAKQDSDNNPSDGLDVSANLRHRVVIPQIIYFRVGSAIPNQVDTVTFNLNQHSDFSNGTSAYSGTSPLGNGNSIAATDNGVLAVDVRSNVGDIAISYEVSNTSGLSDGAGHFIAYDQITTESTDPANLPAPELDNNGGASGSGITVGISGNLFNGRVINRQAQWTYTYKNQTTPVAGTYKGRVTYTAAAP